MLLRGTVDENVEPATPLNRPPDNLSRETLVPKIAGEQFAPAALRLDEALRLSGIVIFFEVCNRDVGAFLRRQDGYRSTNTAVTASNQNDAVFQATRSRRRRLRLRLRHQLRLSAWLAILFLRG